MIHGVLSKTGMQSVNELSTITRRGTLPDNFFLDQFLVQNSNLNVDEVIPNL